MMRRFLRTLFIYFVFIYFPNSAGAQIIVSGTVYDSTKLYAVSDVAVHSSSGNMVKSDSLGVYHIVVNNNDSIWFFYNNKPTMKFPVRKMENYSAFDISLNVKLTSKYRPLKEIRIFSQTYAEKVADNREKYKSVFNYKKPGLVSTSGPNGPPGLDINEIIKVFQFRRNKQLKAFRERLIAEEEEKYIDYRFSSKLLKRITHLDGDSLKLYQKLYRPDYETLTTLDELTLYLYILKAAEEFRLAR